MASFNLAALIVVLACSPAVDSAGTALLEESVAPPSERCAAGSAEPGCVVPGRRARPRFGGEHVLLQLGTHGLKSAALVRKHSPGQERLQPQERQPEEEQGQLPRQPEQLQQQQQQGHQQLQPGQRLQHAQLPAEAPTTAQEQHNQHESLGGQHAEQPEAKQQPAQEQKHPSQPQRVSHRKEIELPAQRLDNSSGHQSVYTQRDEIRVSGRQLLINGRPMHMKGVNWNPVAHGQRPPRGLRFREFVDQDSSMMAQAGINVVRTYEPIVDRAVLDALWAHGIRVANTVYCWGGAHPSIVTGIVDAVKDHPAILMWVIGNEWNYNMLYKQGLNFGDAVWRIREASRLVKEHDTSHPVSSVYGHLPDKQLLDSLPDIDIWGLNVYSGLSLGGIFGEWEARSSLPMYLGEYGADAYNSHRHAIDEEAQAQATTALTQEIVDHSSVTNTHNVCIGGFIFEFADEWWKDNHGSPWVHDVGGIAPGAGPYPDMTFNEEYWGLVHLDRRPRLAYSAYSSIAVPQ